MKAASRSAGSRPSALALALLGATCVLGSIGAAGCGDGGDASPDAGPMTPPDGAVPRQVVMESVPLEINETIEAIMKGGAGDYARLQMTVPGPSLDWNLHGHAGGGTQVVKEEFKATTVDYLFAPSDDADWYLLLRNKGQTNLDVQLRIELYGDITWSGWQ